MICTNLPSALNQCTRCMCCHLPECEGNPLVPTQQSGGTAQTPRSLAQSAGQSFHGPLTGSRIVRNSISCSLSSRISLLLAVLSATCKQASHAPMTSVYLFPFLPRESSRLSLIIKINRAEKPHQDGRGAVLTSSHDHIKMKSKPQNVHP